MRTARIAVPLAALVIAILFAVSSARPILAVEDTVVVQPGDTVIAIANRNGVSVEEIVSLNDLADADRIMVGQVLRVVPDVPTPPAVTEVATAGAATASHVVRAGDNLTGIASYYGTSLSELVRLNGLANPSFIVPGQTLALPAAPAAARPAAAPPAWIEHTVRPGENLTGIASKYGTTVAAIADANGLPNPSFVYAGAVIRVPAAAPAAAPPTAAAPKPAQPAAPRPAPAATSAPAPARAPAAGAVSPLPMPEWMRPLVAEHESVRRMIVAEAQAQGVPPSFALAVAWQESGFQQSVVSSAGAVGVMQVMPDTAEWIATSMLGEPVNIHDTASNVRAGVRLLRHYLDRYDGSRERTLAAYFQGQYAADNYGLYGETYPYIASILLHERFFAG